MIYVDNAGIKAKVGRHNSTWYHLLSDNSDPESLHVFAESIGLKRAYFQPAKQPHLWWRQHYDLTENKRRFAVVKGAIEIDIFQWMEIVMELR